MGAKGSEGMKEMCEEDLKVQISSCKINGSGLYNVGNIVNNYVIFAWWHTVLDLPYWSIWNV